MKGRRERATGPRQTSLFRTHGGKRKGAGRPRVAGSGEPHTERPRLASRHPVHINTKLITGLRVMRQKRIYRAVRSAIADGADRFGMRVVEYSVQSNHLHLICEARDGRSLSRGLQGLFIRVAKAINRQLGRRGRVFADRYHATTLRSPNQVRNALAYVLHNRRRHSPRRPAVPSAGITFDRCSSARSFFGLERCELPSPHTWLLRVGWRRAGPIRLDEIPGRR